ncbi:MAG: hypothetical protein GY820_35495 [Gammaproteobacteria bacterium]|nr:hypothetical protein [Gammaproteobacteria bacterium]
MGETRKTGLVKYTAFLRTAGVNIAPKLMKIFKQAAAGKNHDVIRSEIAEEIEKRNPK